MRAKVDKGSHIARFFFCSKNSTSNSDRSMWEIANMDGFVLDVIYLWPAGSVFLRVGTGGKNGFGTNWYQFLF